MLTPEEVKEKGLPETETTVVALNEAGEPIGWASDEFGSDGIWVVDEYQRKGIGTELLDLFRSQYASDRQLGQMTDAGAELARAYHRRLVERSKK